MSQPLKKENEGISGIHMLSISSHHCAFQQSIVKVNISTPD